MNTILCSSKSRRAQIHLAANQVIAIQGRRGTSIRCMHGLVWVTREGDIQDYTVPRGLRFVATGTGRIVVNGAADHSRVEIGYVDWARTGASAYFAQIESEARHARAAYFAMALDAAAALWGRVWRRVRRWLAGMMAAVGHRKPRGSV